MCCINSRSLNSKLCDQEWVRVGWGGRGRGGWGEWGGDQSCVCLQRCDDVISAVAEFMVSRRPRARYAFNVAA